MMSKARTVMNHSSTVGGVAHFSNFEEGMEPSMVRHLDVPESDWQAMGEPDRITVTFEPGDLLNGEGDADDTVEANDTLGSRGCKDPNCDLDPPHLVHAGWERPSSSDVSAV